jgi:toxin ParE1/3/4
LPGAVASVEFDRQALDDLDDLLALIEADSGRDRADAYKARILRRIAALEMFPFAGRRLALRGTTIRLIGLDRRVTILFRAQRDAVLILRVLYAGRQP